MASRLFHAVVGLGIALGTATVACDGSTDDAATDTSSSEYTSSKKKALPCPESDAGAPADAGADAANTPFDPFCDVSWPTTKGNPNGPTCGDVSECWGAGPAPSCAVPESAGSTICETGVVTGNRVAWCVKGTWQCTPGSIPVDECSCWKGAPACP